MIVNSLVNDGRRTLGQTTTSQLARPRRHSLTRLSVVSVPRVPRAASFSNRASVSCIVDTGMPTDCPSTCPQQTGRPPTTYRTHTEIHVTPDQLAYRSLWVRVHDMRTEAEQAYDIIIAKIQTCHMSCHVTVSLGHLFHGCLFV